MASAPQAILIVGAARDTLRRVGAAVRGRAPGARLIAAGGAADAWRLWRELAPDVILIDEALAEEERGPLIERLAAEGGRAVLLTGGDEAAGLAALARGAHAYVPRTPLRTAELWRTILSAAATAGAAREAATLRTIVGALPVGVWLTDAGGAIVLTNPASERIWGARHTGVEHLGKYRGWWAETGEPLAPSDWSLRRVLASGEPLLNELIEIETFAGERKTIYSSAVPIRGADGEVAGALVVNEDVTPLHHAERARRLSHESEQRALAEAREAVRVRDVYLSVASHELKNPLTALLGHAQMLQRRMVPGAEYGERDARAIGVIADQASRMDRLIEDLLDVSRLERGQIALKRSRTSLSALTRQVVDEVRPSLQRHTLITQIPEGEVAISGDPMRLSQVLHNLIANAVKYSPQGGPVVVRLVEEGGWAALSVIDRGIGIPEAALPSLFRRFYRAENAERMRISGLGVGLFVVREIVTLHGGTIEVESEEQRGSTFTIRLPLEP